jgi:hypothetical protein
MVVSRRIGAAIIAVGLTVGGAASQPVMSTNGRLVPFILHVLPPEARGPTVPSPSNVRRREELPEDAKADVVRKQAAIDAQPANRLLKAYRFYIGVKQCVEARKGYALVYLNEDQMADARARVIAIEKATVGAEPAIDANAIWTKANGPDADNEASDDMTAVIQLADALGKRWLSSPEWVQESHDYCKRRHSALSSLYSIVIPAANVTPKDF